MKEERQDAGAHQLGNNTVMCANLLPQLHVPQTIKAPAHAQNTGVIYLFY